LISSSEAWGIDSLIAKAPELQSALEEARRAAANVPWFPYDSLGNLEHLDRTLTGPCRNLSTLIAGGPVLDVGCGDGEMSFLLESVGLQVRAVDFSPTNANRLEGIRTLKQALNSRVEIVDEDIDAGLRFSSEERFAATFLLGILYHLKNPFGVLETLAKHSRYCFLSTRIARRTPDHVVNLDEYPLAYLVGPEELNADNTNYWIFSEKGLRLLIRRAGWVICDFATFGNTVDSDPISPAGDERAFCLLRSRKLQTIDPGIEILSGWHGDEGGWRWTEGRFSLAITGTAEVTLTFWVNPKLIDQVGSITLRARSETGDLPPCTFSSSGRHTYDVPSASGILEFSTDKAIPPDDADPRERALAVIEISRHA